MLFRSIGGPVITAVLLPPADLITTIVLAPAGPALPGKPFVATVVMSNIGPSPAGNAVVTLQLPLGSTGVVVSGGGVYNFATGVITWPVIPFVPANTAAVATYTVTFTPPATGGIVRSNVTTPDTEVTLTNNPASVAIRIAEVLAEPIPTTPWWLIALVLAGLAQRSFRTRAMGKR